MSVYTCLINLVSELVAFDERKLSLWPHLSIDNDDIDSWLGVSVDKVLASLGQINAWYQVASLIAKLCIRTQKEKERTRLFIFNVNACLKTYQ